MQALRLCAVAFAVALTAPAPCGSTPPARSGAARAAFQRANPCPSTGRPAGPCAGYVVDHIVPLCAGGADAPVNMQWQTAADGLAKDRIERKECRHR